MYGALSSRGASWFIIFCCCCTALKRHQKSVQFLYALCIDSIHSCHHSRTKLDATDFIQRKSETSFFFWNLGIKKGCLSPTEKENSCVLHTTCVQSLKKKVFRLSRVTIRFSPTLIATQFIGRKSSFFFSRSLSRLHLPLETITFLKQFCRATKEGTLK